ncbi:MAG: cryptochrome/photolyase family protein [Paracoccaceae bacterium]
MSDDTETTLLWLRRDLRLDDNPALDAALGRGGPVIPVFVLDPAIEDSYGRAPLWRMGRSLADLARRLEARGSRLVLRRGDALEALRALARETGATGVVWARQYDLAAMERDTAVKAGLREDGLDAVSVNGCLLFEPWTVETGSGGYYKVYTPYWKAVRGRDPGEPLAEPADLAPPERWPGSDALDDWGLEGLMGRGAAVVARFAAPGEEAALARLDAFVQEGIARYDAERDFPAGDGTSTLSEHFATGELSPRRAWAEGTAAMERLSGEAAKSAEAWLQELAWREFSYHLLYHTPRMETENWRSAWDAFPWRDDNDDARAWKRGRTGFEMVDAAMRELYVTGRMHNRMRMLVANVLTKHLMTHWKVGERWFRDCLIDWDVASNSMGWQWSAGSGPDATPYFRIFNPMTQAQKFDKGGAYRDRFLAEGRESPHEDALAFFEAAPRSWGLDPGDPRPAPIVEHKKGRERALAAYHRDR